MLILQLRGMQVTGSAKALEYLKRIGDYDALSGYWHDTRQWQRDAAGQRAVLDPFKPAHSSKVWWRCVLRVFFLAPVRPCDRMGWTRRCRISQAGRQRNVH